MTILYVMIILRNDHFSFDIFFISISYDQFSGKLHSNISFIIKGILSLK